MPHRMSAWLESKGFGRYAELFSDNEIDMDAACLLSDDDLREIGIPLGPRKKLLRALGSLGEIPSPPERGSDRAPPSNTAERRHLTVLFCDLVESTELAVSLDPEEMRDILIRYQDAVAGTIARHDGYVANYLGDGVIAYFGWPRAQEHQAAQAVRAGLDAVSAIDGLSAPGDRALSARVGIATGPVVIGDVDGEMARQSGAITGETPNLAARLQTAADPGAVVMDAATGALVGGEFKLTTLGDKRLKGFAEPQPVLRVDHELGADNRFAVQHPGALSPFFGRRNELGLLEERWETARSGDGQVVMLTGEPGIGKSRLCRELMDRIADQPHFRLRYQCSPNHASSVLYPIIQHLKTAARILPAEPVAAKLDKLEALLARSVPEPARAASVIAAMMGLPTDRYPPLTLSPQRQKEMVLEALFAQLDGLARIQPVLMLLEDAHWIDPTTLEVFDSVAARAQDLPLLLIVTARPEADLPWEVGEHISHLTLARLPKAQCADLVRSLIAQDNHDDTVVEQVVARTDGIPLFVEELSRSLVNRQGLQGPVHVPASLQALLSSRLDQVSPLARSCAQIGSVLGREFSFDALNAMGERSGDEIETGLEELVSSGLVTQHGELRSGKIVFRHALIEEAAYASQLLATRRTRHLRAAEWYEHRVGDGIATEAEEIAGHLIKAGEPARALPYLYEAAKRACAACAFKEATAHLRAGREILDSGVDQKTLNSWQLRFLIALGTTIMAVRGYADEEAGAIFRAAMDLLTADSDAETHFQILWNLWLHNQMSADLVKAARNIDAMKALESSGFSEEQRLQINHAGWTTSFASGNLKAAASHVEAGLAIYDEARHHQSAFHFGGHDPGVCGRSHGQMVHSLMGDLDAGQKYGAEAITMADRLAHPHTLAIAYGFNALGRYFVRDASGALTAAAKSIQMAQEYGPKHFEVLGRCVAAWASGMLGEDDDAPTELRDGLAQSTSIGAILRTPYIALMLADVLRARGAHREALDAVDQAFCRMRHHKSSIVLAEAYRLRGVIESDLGQTLDAKHSIEQAMEFARQQGARLFHLRAAASFVRLDPEPPADHVTRLLTPILAEITATSASQDVLDAEALLHKSQ